MLGGSCPLLPTCDWPFRGSCGWPFDGLLTMAGRSWDIVAGFPSALARFSWHSTVPGAAPVEWTYAGGSVRPTPPTNTSCEWRFGRVPLPLQAIRVLNDTTLLLHAPPVVEWTYGGVEWVFNVTQPSSTPPRSGGFPVVVPGPHDDTPLTPAQVCALFTGAQAPGSFVVNGTWLNGTWVNATLANGTWTLESTTVNASFTGSTPVDSVFVGGVWSTPGAGSTRLEPVLTNATQLPAAQACVNGHLQCRDDHILTCVILPKLPQWETLACHNGVPVINMTAVHALEARWVDDSALPSATAPCNATAGDANCSAVINATSNSTTNATALSNATAVSNITATSNNSTLSNTAVAHCNTTLGGNNCTTNATLVPSNTTTAHNASSVEWWAPISNATAARLCPNKTKLACTPQGVQCRNVTQPVPQLTYDPSWTSSLFAHGTRCRVSRTNASHTFASVYMTTELPPTTSSNTTAVGNSTAAANATTVVGNGTVVNGTVVNGTAVNGTATAVNGTAPKFHTHIILMCGEEETAPVQVPVAEAASAGVCPPNYGADPCVRCLVFTTPQACDVPPHPVFRVFGVSGDGEYRLCALLSTVCRLLALCYCVQCCVLRFGRPCASITPLQSTRACVFGRCRPCNKAGLGTCPTAGHSI